MKKTLLILLLSAGMLYSSCSKQEESPDPAAKASNNNNNGGNNNGGGNNGGGNQNQQPTLTVTSTGEFWGKMNAVVKDYKVGVDGVVALSVSVRTPDGTNPADELDFTSSVGKASGEGVTVSFWQLVPTGENITDAEFNARFTVGVKQYTTITNPEKGISVSYTDANGDDWSTIGVVQPSGTLEILDVQQSTGTSGKAKVRVVFKFSCDMKKDGGGGNLSIVDGIMVGDFENNPM